MKIFLFTLNFFVLQLIIAQNNFQYVSFSGKIENHNGNEVKIYQGNKYMKVIQLSEDGSFSDTLHVKKGMYTFRDIKEVTPVYLSPGYDLNISLDTKEFDESIVYKGKGSGPNTYLSKLFLYNEDNEVSFFQEKEFSEHEYFKYVINLYNGAIQLLESLVIKDSEFCSLQREKQYYNSLSKLLKRKKEHFLLTRNDSSVISNHLIRELNKIDLNDTLEYKNRDYRNLVIAYYEYGLISADENTINQFKELKSNLRKDVLTRMEHNISIREENFEDYFNTLISICEDETQIQRITKKYNKLVKLKPGNSSPSFTCKNYNGETIKLSDYIGSLVYIDLWATWCGPCKVQIPYLNELEKKYINKNISFISISIDDKEDIEKWKQMIKEKEMGGIQLIAENAWESEFAIAYSLQGIPRFIIIDQQGNIIDANAPRPMTYNNEGKPILNKEIIYLIEQHLN